MDRSHRWDRCRPPLDKVAAITAAAEWDSISILKTGNGISSVIRWIPVRPGIARGDLSCRLPAWIRRWPVAKLADFDA
jgi:hypothetical protein